MSSEKAAAEARKSAVRELVQLSLEEERLARDVEELRCTLVEAERKAFSQKLGLVRAQGLAESLELSGVYVDRYTAYRVTGSRIEVVEKNYGFRDCFIEDDA